MTSALLDHLWQSTLMALAVGLLTLAFHRAGPAVRHRLWLAASVKFLIPFAILATLGKALAAGHSPIEAPAGAVLVARAAQPFSQVQPTGAALHVAAWLDPGSILLAVWALGVVAMLAVWTARWAQVRRIVRSSTPLALSAPMPVLASDSTLEPGLVGLFRPVLLVPASLFDHLDRPGITALVAHEAEHLRRRDNLTATIHMVVEALFWFHPLVWWIGARLIEERELACDEAVVRSGHDRAAYATSLVETCRLYLRSPLSCVAGASGSDLKRRVQMILTASPAPRLPASGKAVLAAAALVAFATPVAAGWLVSPVGHAVATHVAAVVFQSAAAPEVEASRTRPVSARAVPAGSEETAAAAPAEDAMPSAPSPTMVEPAPPAAVTAQPGAAPASLPVQPTSAQSGALAGPSVRAQPVSRSESVATEAAEVGEANCYPVFGELRCGRLPVTASQEKQTTGAAAPTTVAAALSLPLARAASATPRTAAPAPSKVQAPYEIASLDDSDRILCQTRPITGSRFDRHICMTRAQWKSQQARVFSFERFWGLDPSGDAGASN